MATIKDIAMACHVGIGTVSRVLNGGENVSDKTMRLVIETAERLGYQANSAARVLAKGDYSRKTVGVILPVIAHPFYFEIIKGIYDRLTQSDFNLLLFNTGKDEKQFIHHLIQENLAGVLFVAFSPIEEELKILKLNQNRIGFIDYSKQGENSIFTDNYEGGVLVARHFLDRGYRKIAYIGESIVSPHQTQRLAGFTDTLKAVGISLTAERRVLINEENARYATRDILEKHPDTEAIFYFCDTLALAGLSVIRENGKSIDIVGYDDLPQSQYIGLSSVNQSAYDMGYIGTDRLLEFIQTARNPMENIRQVPKLMIRD